MSCSIVYFYLFIYTIFQEGDIFSSTTSLSYGPVLIQRITKKITGRNVLAFITGELLVSMCLSRSTCKFTPKFNY